MTTNRIKSTWPEIRYSGRPQYPVRRPASQILLHPKAVVGADVTRSKLLGPFAPGSSSSRPSGVSDDGFKITPLRQSNSTLPNNVDRPTTDFFIRFSSHPASNSVGRNAICKHFGYFSKKSDVPALPPKSPWRHQTLLLRSQSRPISYVTRLARQQARSKRDGHLPTSGYALAVGNDILANHLGGGDHRPIVRTKCLAFR